MPARRFFVGGVHAAGERVSIAGGDARKIVSVLRLTDGASVELIDSAGTLFAARLELDGDAVRAALLSADAATDDGSLVVDVAQAIPKGQKMDFVVEKTAELGANAILPFYSERSVVHGIGSSKVERWRRLAKAAAAQSGRRTVPEVASPVSFETLLTRFASYDLVLFPWELAPQIPLRESLPPLLARARQVLVAVGPEGGFSHDEADAAGTAGAGLIWLGPRILRTETAAMAMLAIVGAFGRYAS